MTHGAVGELIFQNGYNYANANPVNFVDPSGMCWDHPMTTSNQQTQCLDAWNNYVLNIDLGDATLRDLVRQEDTYWGSLSYSEFVNLWNDNRRRPAPSTDPGGETLAAGAAIVLPISQLDTPIPGPADVITLLGLVCVVGIAAIAGAGAIALPQRQVYYFNDADVSEGDEAVPIPIPQNPPRSCSNAYPNLTLCNSLPYSYAYQSANQALNALKQQTGINRLSLHNPSPSTSGPCPGSGTHYNVRYQGIKYGSINCCPCCQDNPGGPVQRTLCRII